MACFLGSMILSQNPNKLFVHGITQTYAMNVSSWEKRNQPTSWQILKII